MIRSGGRWVLVFPERLEAVYRRGLMERLWLETAMAVVGER